MSDIPVWRGLTTPKPKKSDEFNSIWIEGDLIVSGGDKKCYIHPRSNRVIAEVSSGRLIVMHEVIPETVGMKAPYKTMCDTAIFDGDIVAYPGPLGYDDFSCVSVVHLGEYGQDGSGGEYPPHKVNGWYVEIDHFSIIPDWAQDDPTFFPEYLHQQSLQEVASTCRVIGNIHADKHLLKAFAELLPATDQAQAETCKQHIQTLPGYPDGIPTETANEIYVQAVERAEKHGHSVAILDLT